MMHTFCVSDPVRYQLLFQRPIPGFEPSADAYAIAVEVLEHFRNRVRAAGIEDHDFAVDLWTAVSSGITSQQLANDPGGNRYERLIDRAVEMVLREVGYRRTNERKGKR
jgi:hypothetical protein